MLRAAAAAVAQLLLLLLHSRATSEHVLLASSCASLDDVGSLRGAQMGASSQSTVYCMVYGGQVACTLTDAPSALLSCLSDMHTRQSLSPPSGHR
jgi:hypothetical protein